VTELDIDVSVGPVCAITVLGLAGIRKVISGPCRLYGWSFRESFGVPDVPAGGPNAITGNIAAAVGGNVAIPANSSLTGFDIDLSTVGTAAMIVTVTNVPGGPYTYILPAGQARLSVTFPVELPPTGGAPNVAWSATAAAVGTIVAYGVTSGAGSGNAAIIEFTSGGNLLAEAEIQPGATHNAWFGPMGIHIPQDVTINVTGSFAQGAIYAAYYRELP
jgi:hypothetical protein